MQVDDSRTNRQNNLLSAHELAEALGVSTATVAHWRREGLIPYVRFSRRVVRYRLADALAAFERSASKGEAK
jgi:predicted site-specific integrase-resolvase